VLYSYKFNTKGGKITEHKPRVISSHQMQPPGRHTKLNPITIMRTSEEMDMS